MITKRSCLSAEDIMSAIMSLLDPLSVLRIKSNLPPPPLPALRRFARREESRGD